MYIIVVGGGQVGYHLARQLISEGHEVLIVEKELSTVNRINDELGSISQRGDGCEVATLDEVGAARADVLIAVTGDDEDNLVACQIAKVRFQVPRAIARINNPKNDRIFRILGIDATVSSTKLILEHIGHEVPEHPLVHLLDLARFGLEIIDVTVSADGPAAGKRISDLALPPDTMLSLVVSKDRGPVAPRPDLQLNAGDEVIAVTPTEAEGRLRRLIAGV